MAGVHTAYYLVHSMGSPGQFDQEDRQAAHNFADAACESGIRRIIYLGGLGNEDQALSAHLRSRHEVANILRSSGIPTLEFRASIVIGSGSLSFELIRALVQRLPVMICPRWVDVKAQPIAVEDVIAYLIEALELPVEQRSVFEIGGTDQHEPMPVTHDIANHAVILSVGLRSDRVWHFWSASPRAALPFGSLEGCIVKARVKISPGVLLQIGMDYWRTPTIAYGAGGNNHEAGASNWYFPSEQWQEAGFTDIGGPQF